MTQKETYTLVATALVLGGLYYMYETRKKKLDAPFKANFDAESKKLKGIKSKNYVGFAEQNLNVEQSQFN